MTEDLEEMLTVGVSSRWRDERRPTEGAPYVRDNGRDPLWDVRGGRDDMLRLAYTRRRATGRGKRCSEDDEAGF